MKSALKYLFIKMVIVTYLLMSDISLSLSLSLSLERERERE